MVSDAQIRELCFKAMSETDPEEVLELLAGLQMLAHQYLRERSLLLEHSGFLGPSDSASPHGRKRAA